MNNSLTLTGYNDGNITLLSSIAGEDEEIQNELKAQYGLSDEDIFNATPSSNKKVAALSDEIFKYSIENNVTSLEKIDVKELESSMHKRVTKYSEVDTSSAELEKELVDDLDVDKLTEENVKKHDREREESHARGQENGDKNSSEGKEHQENGDKNSSEGKEHQENGDKNSSEGGKKHRANQEDNATIENQEENTTL